MLSVAWPSEEVFSWPLVIGSAWQGCFSYTDYERGRCFSAVTSQYRLTGYDNLAVQAGTFKALRIEGTPLSGSPSQERFGMLQFLA
jgi:hypothetical protein